MAATTTRHSDARPARVQGGAQGADQRPPLRRLVRVGVWIVVVLAWVYAIFGSEGLMAQLERRRERAALTLELEREAARSAEMRREAKALKTDDLAIEREVRTLFDLQRPGEIVYIVEEEDPLLRAEMERSEGD